MTADHKVVCEICLNTVDESDVGEISLGKLACSTCRSPEGLALSAWLAGEQQQIIDNAMRLSLAH